MISYYYIVYNNFCRITHRFTRKLMWNSQMILKYHQDHRQSYHLKAVVWFVISNFSLCGRNRRIAYNFRDIGRGNENIGWNDLQMSLKVIQRGTNRKLVYELLLVDYIVTFAISLIVSEIQTVSMLSENHILPTSLSCIWPWIWRSCRWNVETKVGVRKLESWGCGCDRRTDRHSDRQTNKPVADPAMSRPGDSIDENLGCSVFRQLIERSN